MKKKIYLITTNIERSFSKKKNNFFTGDWCQRFARLSKKELKKTEVENSIWDNIHRRKKDYKHLKKIIKKHLNILPDYLNEFHKSNYPKRFWQNILFLWVTYYITFQYYRLETLNNIFKKRKNLIFFKLNCEDKNFVATDSLDFFQLGAKSDAFNYFHFKRIINFLQINNKIRIKIINKQSKGNLNQLLNLDKKEYQDKNKKDAAFGFKNLMRVFLLNFSKNNRFIIRDGFSLKNLFLINIFFGRFPITFPNEFIWNIRKDEFYKVSANIKKRDKIKYKFKHKNVFDKYIGKYIFRDIPTCYLEGFNNLNQIVNKINLSPNLIFSSAKYFHDEIFKLWVTREQVLKGKKFFVIEHGGWHHENKSIFNYQDFVSDETIEWIKNKKKKSLPIPYFILRNKKRKSKEHLLFAGNEFNPYPLRNAPGPVSFSSFKTIDDVNILYNKLLPKPKSQFFYAIKNNFEKVHYNEISKVIGKDKILKKGSFSKYLYKSKLIICSYAQTAFLESIVTGPTILIYNPKQWIHQKQFNESYKKLKKSKIVFDDPILAAEHINDNWDRIDQWWNQSNVKNSRNHFLNQFNLPTSSNIKKWYHFINTNIKN